MKKNILKATLVFLTWIPTLAVLNESENYYINLFAFAYVVALIIFYKWTPPGRNLIQAATAVAEKFFNIDSELK